VRDPHKVLRLSVDSGHELYIETRGNSAAPAAVYLHGGPGSGCQPMHHRLFDDQAWFSVFPDQRGSGRSTPHGSREANTTAHLVADLETLRQALGLESWLVVGGSWGATLALAYAEAHPERVTGLVLRATFLGTREELDWSFGTGLSTFYPDLHQRLLALLEPNEHSNPLHTLWRLMLRGDPARSPEAAWTFAEVETALSQLVAPPPGPRRPGNPPSTALMEAHYFAHDCFMSPGQLLANADRLAGIPGVIVQGRYDLLCPPITATRLCAVWPDAQLRLVETAGHSLGQPEIFAAVADAITDIARDDAFAARARIHRPQAAQ
jgi:proline iminopeptidase